MPWLTPTRTVALALAGTLTWALDGAPQPGRISDLLPMQEIPKVQIGWYVNRTQAAHEKAIATRRPLVVVLSTENCGSCARLVQNTLRCAAVNRLAGAAVFAYADPNVDPGAKPFASGTSRAYPSTSIFAPGVGQPRRWNTVAGFLEARAFGSAVERSVWWRPPPPPPPPPSPWKPGGKPAETPARKTDQTTMRWADVPPPDGPPGTIAGVMAGRLLHNLTDKPPAPVCR